MDHDDCAERIELLERKIDALLRGLGRGLMPHEFQPVVEAVRAVEPTRKRPTLGELSSPRGASMSDQIYMVFDVESIGLHGEGWAVGYQVVDEIGVPLGRAGYACPPDEAAGSAEGRAWVAETCPPLGVSCMTPREVRDAFWRDWLRWKKLGAVLVADCQWPVEARFLIACVDDDPEARAWEGPYPLHELASFMVAAGMDPHATYDRDETEAQHNPVGDARQSARLLIEALGRLRPA